MTTGERTKQISVALDKETRTNLLSVARERGTTEAAVIREAVLSHFLKLKRDVVFGNKPTKKG